jgi:phage tail sheath protein FI
VSYQSPGVYIEEVPSGPQPIAAAPTSVMAIVGTTARGPVMTPTRVTGWGEYQKRFGGHAHAGYTAEAISGFFANGGPAAYIVRVDPSLAAEWTVEDAAGNEAFRIQAGSPGAWANGLEVAVAPDEKGGSGTMYYATLTAADSVPSATATDLAVSSTEAVAVGDAVVLIPAAAGTSAAEAAVQGVDAAGAEVTVLKASSGTLALAQGDVITSLAEAGDTVLNLASANGFKTGDVIVAELPDRTRITALVANAAQAGAGMTLTLAAGLSADVPGAQLATRIVRLRGTIGTLDTTVALSEVTWDDEPALGPLTTEQTDAFRAFAANGLQGQWKSSIGSGAFQFPVAPPAGPIEAEATLQAHRYEETGLNLVDPQLPDLATQFSFVPTDTKLRLTRSGGTATLTRTASGFTTTDSLTGTFTAARFLLPADASDGVVVRALRDIEEGDFVQFSGTARLRVDSVDRLGGTLQVLHFTDTTDISGVTADRFAVMAFEQTQFYPLRFAIDIAGPGTAAERYEGLALSTNHPRYYFKDGVVNQMSAAIRVTQRNPATPVTAASLPVAVTRTTDGRDDPAGSSHLRKGFETLEEEPEPAMVICPETVSLADPLAAAGVIGAMVEHCRVFRRLAIVDTPNEKDDQKLLAWRNKNVASTYAATYAPHVQIESLEESPTERFPFVPPSGFVAGVMARTDRTPPGVAKAPANTPVNGIVGLAKTYTNRHQDLLNPGAVNLIRYFPGRGNLVWGARNSTDDGQFRYVNVRRLFNAIETSIERGTQWVVFEPNTATTWLRVKVSVEGFLEQAWRAGQLAGATQEQAYRVRVGLGETMIEADVDNGIVIVEVAIAPAKPAEFVVFRFSHKRLSE